LGLLYAPEKGSETRAKLDKKLKKFTREFDGNCSKEQLEFVKGKLEQHKQRLERHLQKINSRLAEKEPNS
jgi:gas vesicle protein